VGCDTLTAYEVSQTGTRGYSADRKPVGVGGWK